MGQITSGIGLVSGINTADIINQLLALEARPKQLVAQRNAVLTTQQIAFQDISAKLLNLKLSASSFIDDNTFESTSATTSNENVLGVTSSTSAVPGTYDFHVSRLVSTQQLITGGFADKDINPVAPAGASFTFEFGDARLDTDTHLSTLNGGQGVQRGDIRITDRSGSSATVDLSKALTVDDVLEAINTTSGISVEASVDGDGFKLTDLTGAAVTSLAVAEVTGGTTAAALGLNVASVGDTITGSQVNTLGDDTSLTLLNDGNGVRVKQAQDDFRVTRRDGTTFDVDLAGATDIGAVIEAINTADAGGGVTASISDDGTGLKLVDATVGATTFQVTAENNSNAASDLGILTTDGDDDGQITGDRLIATLNSKLIKHLNGGQGAGISGGNAALQSGTPLSALFNDTGLPTNGSGASPDITVQDRTGATYQIELDGLSTVQDLIDAFDTATGGAVTLSIDGQALKVINSSIGINNFQVQDINGSTAATKLGITIDSAPLGPEEQTGTDTEPQAFSSIQLTDRSGASATIDLTNLRTISEVLDTINNAAVGITASLNTAGNGLKLTDTTGATTGNLTVTDLDGGAAAALGLAGSVAANTIDSGNLQFQYVSEGTLLSALNGGGGVASGKFVITDSNGQSGTIDLTQGNEVTVGNVISEINAVASGLGLQINARVNDNGDGFVIEDTGPGLVAIKIEESGSSTARDLGLLGEAENAGDDLTGSYERTVTIEATDTLSDIAQAINDAGIDVSATIINDGSIGKPFRLNLISENQGLTGAFVFDDGGTGIGASTLSEATNAVVFFGSSDPAKAIAITSATNTLTTVVPGATIDLKGTSDSTVQVAISRDDSTIVDAVSSFVKNFNTVTSTLNDVDSYNADTEERGLLLGDPTVARVRSSLYRLVNNRNNDLTSQFSTLAQIGVTVGGGARLNFDETKFRAALEADFDAVQALFTFKETEVDEDTNEQTTIAAGIGVRIDELLESLTDPTNGLLQTKIDSLNSQIQLGNDRIEQIDVQLLSKRAKLEAEFLAMELAISNLQSQSQALASFQPVQALSSNNSGSNGLF